MWVLEGSEVAHGSYPIVGYLVNILILELTTKCVNKIDKLSQ